MRICDHSCVVKLVHTGCVRDSTVRDENVASLGYHLVETLAVTDTLTDGLDVRVRRVETRTVGFVEVFVDGYQTVVSAKISL